MMHEWGYNIFNMNLLTYKEIIDIAEGQRITEKERAKNLKK